MKLSYRNERNARFISEVYGKPLEKPDWYKIENLDDNEAEILIYDVIGWPFNDAEGFVRSIDDLSGKNLTIRINSPGGDVFDAHAIFNAIKAHKGKTVTRVESLAASAASYILVAGGERQAYKNAMVMIHEPWTGFWGNQYEMREVADILKQISESMIDMYADNSNIGKRDLKSMLKEETWMKASEAKEKGFVDTVFNAGGQADATFDLSMFAKTPDQFHAASKKPTNRNIERALRDAGLSRTEAKAMLAGRQRGDGDSEERLKSLEAQIAAQATLLKFKGN
jgi:ATP-dependent Clp endopeptidase proteolytic subunit ClpP